MEIHFEEATLDDADALLHLVHQLEHFISAETLLNNLKNNSENKDYRLFVAKENTQVIAFAELCFTQFIHEATPKARLTSFCVDEAHRNKKAGASFLEFIEHYCRKTGCSKIELTSNIRRTDAHRFYESNGYVYTSKRFLKEL